MNGLKISTGFGRVSINGSERAHLQELWDKQHIAVHEAYQKNPKAPNLCKAKFFEFLIEKYQEYLNIPRDIVGA